MSFKHILQKKLINKFAVVFDILKFNIIQFLFHVLCCSIIFFVIFLGCVGALRENTWFLAIYSSMLGLLLLAEAVIVVIAVVSKDWIEIELRTKFNDMVW